MVNNWLHEFGFSQNPYNTRALLDEEGNKLLIGRENETTLLAESLTSSRNISVLVGDNGVGKTSIANIVVYRLIIENQDSNQRYFHLPLNDAQGIDFSDLVRYENYLYKKIITLLLNENSFLKQHGINSTEISAVKQFTQNLFNVSGGIGSFSLDVSPNESAQEQLKVIAQKWLKKCFCKEHSGGIICIIDNIENVGTSHEVQLLLERLRDTFFSIHGLLWIVCGTPMALEGAFKSPILSGYLKQIEVHPIKPNLTAKLLEERISRYGNQKTDPPVNGSRFLVLYEATNSHLRTSLELCEKFAQHLYHFPARRLNDKSEELRKWLIQNAAELPKRRYEVPDDAWRLFDDITSLGADYIPSTDYRLYNIDSLDSFKRIVEPLIKKTLLMYVCPNNESNELTLKVTTDGWLVHYWRKTMAEEERF